MNDELSSLVAEHTAPLMRGALARGLSQSDAEELVQETFVAYLEARARFQGRSSLRTYLFGILYHKAAELARQRSRETSTEDIEKLFGSRFDGRGHWLSQGPRGPEEESLTHALAAAIRDCAQKLSATQRSAFFLKEAEGVPSEDVCNILSITDTNLRVLLFRARLRLRECLAKAWKSR